MDPGFTTSAQLAGQEVNQHLITVLSFLTDFCHPVTCERAFRPHGRASVFSATMSLQSINISRTRIPVMKRCNQSTAATLAPADLHLPPAVLCCPLLNVHWINATTCMCTCGQACVCLVCVCVLRPGQECMACFADC